MTIFQPFRMATMVRGLAIIMISGRLVALWRSGPAAGRVRSILLATSFLGDWLLVVVTLAEVAVSIVEVLRVCSGRASGGRQPPVFEGRHPPDRGPMPPARPNLTLREQTLSSRDRFDILNVVVFVGAIGWGLNFLGHHDTESGHIPLMMALGVGLLAELVRELNDWLVHSRGLLPKNPSVPPPS